MKSGGTFVFRGCSGLGIFCKNGSQILYFPTASFSRFAIVSRSGFWGKDFDGFPEAQEVFLQFIVKDDLYLEDGVTVFANLNHHLALVKWFGADVRHLPRICPEAHFLWLHGAVLGDTNHVLEPGLRIELVYWGEFASLWRRLQALDTVQCQINHIYLACLRTR